MTQIRRMRIHLEQDDAVLETDMNVVLPVFAEDN